MAEVLFYHLTRSTLEGTLPGLLERSLERGWNAIVQTSTKERCDALTNELWTYKDGSFLPHGTREDGDPAKQPIYLTDKEENPNAAQVLFLVEGSVPGDISAYERCVLMFDGLNDAAVAAARGHWKTLQGAGHAVTYWKQAETGRWEKAG